MSERDELFIGWSAKSPRADRRFMLGASLGLLATAGLAGYGFAQRKPGPQVGRWDQGAVTRYAGTVVETPYPTLIGQGTDGRARSMLLVGYDKTALRLRGSGPMTVELEASAITHGDSIMLAVADVAAYQRHDGRSTAPPLDDADLGIASIVGEIVDAKCWFGAMNPGVGLTHKACAALCLRGGLPLAFCARGACGAGDEVRLFLDDAGKPHGRALAPFLADPVMAEGRMMRRNGILEFRVALNAITRI
jgi:hypothetical protein